jgi:hypothetical protein
MAVVQHLSALAMKCELYLIITVSSARLMCEMYSNAATV